MRCLPRPRNRGRSSTFLCPYQTSTRSRYNRASTCAPIKRLFTEYALRSTWIRLPESTFTRSRLADSIRRAGNSRITAISSDNPEKPSLAPSRFGSRLFPSGRPPRHSQLGYQKGQIDSRPVMPSISTRLSHSGAHRRMGPYGGALLRRARNLDRDGGIVEFGHHWDLS